MQVNGAAIAAVGARLGWKLVKLHGVRSAGVCRCSKGSACGTPGKHPIAAGWPALATDDEETVSQWFEDDPDANIGVFLGPKSGLVDIELDGPDAIESWNRLGLGEVWTPTYTAGRGPHRLFRWQEGLPDAQVRKVAGLEFRLGNGGKASQSVIPPSMHYSGKRYQWVDGLGPDDVELAPIPEKLLTLLWNDDPAGGALNAKRPARLLLREKVSYSPGGDGPGRNNELYRFAVREAFRAGPDLEHPTEQGDLLMKIRFMNQFQIDPSLEEPEVTSIYRSAIQFVRKSRAQQQDPAAAMEAASLVELAPEDARAEAIEQQDSSATRSSSPAQSCTVFSESGLVFAPMPGTTDSDPEWWPGEWQLTIVHDDPIYYTLHAPAWKVHTSDGTGNVTLNVDQYRSAAKVAAAILAATGRVMLDKEPKLWSRIWDGGMKVQDQKSSKAPKTRQAVGLKAKLLDNALEEFPGEYSKRYVQLAGFLYDRLCNASPGTDDDVPDSTGRPCWRQDGTLWFAWGRVWEDIEKNQHIREGERVALKRRILAALDGQRDFQEGRYRHTVGLRRRYMVWDRREYAALERIAAGGEDDPKSQPPLITRENEDGSEFRSEGRAFRASDTETVSG